jgi:hypothetical protein
MLVERVMMSAVHWRRRRMKMGTTTKKLEKATSVVLTTYKQHLNQLQSFEVVFELPHLHHQHLPHLCVLERRHHGLRRRRRRRIASEQEVRVPSCNTQKEGV